MRIFKYFISSNSYFGNVITLITGSALAQAIPVAIAPILTRLFSPEDFALLALYMAITSVFSTLATLRYELAVVLPESECDGINVLVLSLTIAFIMSLFSIGFLIVMRNSISTYFSNKDIGNWLFLIPISIMVIASYRTFTYWANRKKKYKEMAMVKISQTIATGAFNTTGGIIGVNGGGLILGELTGYATGTLILALKMKQDYNLFKYLNIKKMLYNAKKYSDFPKINSIHSLVDVLQSSGLIFIISSFFGAPILGLYSLTMRVLTAPVGVIGSSVAQVFYQRASRLYNDKKDVYGLLITTTKNLAIFSIPFFFILMLLAPAVFSFFFGEKWREAGEYAQILIPWTALHFIVMPITQMPIVLCKQKIAFIFGLFGNVVMLLAIVIGGYMNDIKLGLMLMSGGMVFCLMMYFLWIIKTTKKLILVV